jgi:O-antigen/teichoic acid export membrane protein
LGKVLVLVSTIVLARVLTPGDFGLVGLALVFILYADVVTDLGVAQALVYLPSRRSLANTAVVTSLAVSGTLFVVAMLAAPLAAQFFGRPEVTGMFRVLSFSLVLRAAGQVPDALLRKELRFRERLLGEISRAIAQGGISVGLALAGFGPWAIVLGYLAGSAAWSAVLWRLCGYRPRRDVWHVQPDDLRPLLGFGLPAAATALLLTLVFNVDYLIVGRWLGARALGYYTVGFRIPELLILNVFNVISSVAFPLYSRVREDRVRLRRGYLFGLRLQAVYGLSAGIGLALLAPMLVHVAFGARWNPTIVPLQALALYAAFRSLGMGPHEAFRGVGRPGVVLALSLVRLVVLVPALLVATRYGINGVSWAQAVVAFPLAVAMQAVASRLLGLPAGQLVAAAVPALAACLGTALGIAVVLLWIPGPEQLRLAAGLSAGCAGALLALYLTNRAFLLEAAGLVVNRLRPGTPLLAVRP